MCCGQHSVPIKVPLIVLALPCKKAGVRMTIGEVAWLVLFALRDGRCLVFEVGFGASLIICGSAGMSWFFFRH